MDLQIGQPVKAVVYTDTYKIVISNMHGDADSYTYNTVYDKSKEEALKTIEFCKWVEKNDPCHSDVYEKSNELFGHEDAWSGLLEGDCTCDGQRFCSPRIETVTYFDKDGIEYNVRIV